MPTREDAGLLFEDEPSNSINVAGTRRKWNFSLKKKMYICLVGSLIFSFILAVIILAARKNPNTTQREVDQKTFEEFESAFLNTVNGHQIKSFMKEYSSESHIAGSDTDYKQALSVKAKFESYGFSTEIESYPVLLSYPVSRLVELADQSFRCSLKEDVIDDGTSDKPAIDTFNGYSPSGDVTGKLVYANYGRLEDYEELEKRSIDLSGKIVIVRYGKIFRANKVKMAQERGAIGVLIYTDPADTGFTRGPVYPDGPWSTNTTVQRGTIWTGNGDPLTPGWPSTFGGAALKLEEATDPNVVNDPLPLIPVQPISYGDAAPLLKTLGGEAVPESWSGGLDFGYHFGPGASVHMKIESNFTVTTIWNVCGMIQGNFEPDRYVILGSHRDAWTFGAGDPISGTSTLLEVARSFGELLKQGWEPRRGVMFCSWDAEEYGLVGSVEYVETHYHELYSRAVAYLNVDIAVKGMDFFSVNGSPSLLNLMAELTKKVPYKSKSVYDVWRPEMGLLGSGSDFVGFIHHVGVTSATYGFFSENFQYQAVYHSNYDSYYWFTHFGDTEDFAAHSAIAKVFGLTAFHLASKRVINYSVQNYADAILGYIDSIQNLTTSISLSPIKDSLQAMTIAADSIAAEIRLALDYSPEMSVERLRFLNDRLMFIDRTFLGDKTLSGREWYKHVIFAPSKIDSYSGQAFPVLYQEIKNGNTEKAKFLISRIATMISSTAKFLKG